MKDDARDKSKRPYTTIRRRGRLKSVFSGDISSDLHAQIARLCVLFEDLRIEVYGIAADDVSRLDEAGRRTREIYFLRRSIGTLFEFSEALASIDASPEFAQIKSRFDGEMLAVWSRSVGFFKKHYSTIAAVRHHVGGHFGKQATEHAVDNLLADARGWVEVDFYVNGGGAILGFAGEIAATAMVQNTLRGAKDRGDLYRIRHLTRMATVGYRNAVRAVDCITVTHLWDRFGG